MKRLWGVKKYLDKLSLGKTGWKYEKERKNRICPYCLSTEIKFEGQMGLAPGNIWLDIICLGCLARWEKSSKKDELSKKLARGILLK